MKKNGFILLSCFIANMFCLAQTSKRINGLFYWENDTSVKLIIKNGKFAYIDSRKIGHLATPCCDTLAYGYITFENNEYLKLEGDSSLNPMFISMNVVERKIKDSDSVFFSIQNPIEKEYEKFNSKGSDLIYKLLVEADSKSIDYFKENNQPFENGNIQFYNPEKRSIDNFSITIEPKNSIYVKNLSVRELNTLTYYVKNKESNFFEINMPQLSYGFISYKRIHGEFAKFKNGDEIIWDNKKFVKKNKLK